MRRRATRDALVLAVIGRPEGLPGPERVDLAAFWARFDALAPLHVRLGFGAATVAVGVVAPRLAGHRHGLASLDAATADAVVRRAAANPLVRPVLDAAVVVACFAYFDDDRVEAAVRGPLRVAAEASTEEQS